jgi:hypothetical protein
MEEELQGTEPKVETVRRARRTRMDIAMRNRKIMNKIVSGEAKSLYQAAKMTGCSEYEAKSSIYRDGQLKEMLQQRLEKAGLDDDALTNKLKGLLDSTKVVWNPEEKCFQLYPDNETQRQALHMAFKLKDLYPSEKVDASSNTFNLVILNKGSDGV